MKTFVLALSLANLSIVTFSMVGMACHFTPPRALVFVGVWLVVFAMASIIMGKAL